MTGCTVERMPDDPRERAERLRQQTIAALAVGDARAAVMSGRAWLTSVRDLEATSSERTGRLQLLTPLLCAAQSLPPSETVAFAELMAAEASAAADAFAVEKAAVFGHDDPERHVRSYPYVGVWIRAIEARADALVRLGRHPDAREALQSALALASAANERREATRLSRRVSALG